MPGVAPNRWVFITTDLSCPKADLNFCQQSLNLNKTPVYEINRAAVIGAGTMGLGIAGQLANAGVEVLLLDIW